MIVIVGLAVVSVATGLDKGIKILSETNMVLAVILLLLIFVLGPTVFLLQAYLQNIGDYIADIIHNTFNLFAYKKTDWIGGWTIFYWGWCLLGHLLLVCLLPEFLVVERSENLLLGLC